MQLQHGAKYALLRFNAVRRLALHVGQSVSTGARQPLIFRSSGQSWQRAPFNDSAEQIGLLLGQRDDVRKFLIDFNKGFRCEPEQTKLALFALLLSVLFSIACRCHRRGFSCPREPPMAIFS